VRADDSGELLAKVCGVLGSVAILVCVVASDVGWVQDLDGSIDQGDGMGKALVRAVDPAGLQRVKVPRQGIRSADMPGSWYVNLEHPISLPLEPRVINKSTSGSSSLMAVSSALIGPGLDVCWSRFLSILVERMPCLCRSRYPLSVAV
jgi:hypothetical protein